jgi:hypothetical protein
MWLTKGVVVMTDQGSCDYTVKLQKLLAGDRPEMFTMHIVLIETMMQLKRAGAICSNDAKSCYDLIGHPQTSISMQRMGVSKNAVNCLFTTLQEAVRQVLTAYGEFLQTYGGRVWLVLIHGIGKGNGTGTAIWVVVSTPLLNILSAKGFCCKLCLPLSNTYISFIGYAFADETDLIQFSLSNDSTPALGEMQIAIDTWEKSLKVTCGAIVPEK